MFCKSIHACTSSVVRFQGILEAFLAFSLSAGLNGVAEELQFTALMLTIKVMRFEVRRVISHIQYLYEESGTLWIASVPSPTSTLEKLALAKLLPNE